MRRLLIASALAVTLTACLAAPAGADARTFKTSGSFGFFEGSPDAFLGQLDSPKRACRAGRIVKVYRVRGRRHVLVGSDRASSTGQWVVERANVRSARYYAKAARKKIGRNRFCGAWRSSKLRFG